MTTRTQDRPWYLTEPPRALACAYLMRDLTLRVDDVAHLDLGIDLLVRPRAEDEDWAFGVVTDGAVTLPDDAERVPDENAITLPVRHLHVPAPADLPDMPVVFMYFTMDDEVGYAGILDPSKELWAYLSGVAAYMPGSAERHVWLRALPFGHLTHEGERALLTKMEDEHAATFTAFLNELSRIHFRAEVAGRDASVPSSEGPSSLRALLARAAAPDRAATSDDG
jgi:hypothetical protein